MKQLQVSLTTGNTANYVTLTFPDYSSHSLEESAGFQMLRVYGAGGDLVGEVPAHKVHYVLVVDAPVPAPVDGDGQA